MSSAVRSIRVYSVVMLALSSFIGILHWNSPEPRMYVYMMMGFGGWLTYNALKTIEEKIENLKDKK